jgi:two-component system nitrate/nitrite response regulator NarL
MNAHQPVRILVVDDHTLFRRGLISLLAGDARFTVVAEAGDAGEAQRRAQQTQPDLILLDNHLPGVNGVEAMAGLREAAPQARVLMLTVSEDQRDLAAALRAGAHGYLLKTVDSDGLAQALLRTMAGDAVVSPELTSKLVSAFQAMPGRETTLVAPDTSKSKAPPSPDLAAAAALAALSPREQEILRHIAKGASNKEIARALTIAETTVKIHVQHILRKLKLSSRVQAAVFAASGPQRWQTQAASGEPSA